MASFTQKRNTDDSVQIVLIGNSGSGKSSSGNTILNKKVFLSTASPKSVTRKYQTETEIINGRTVTVADTPGWDCTELSQQDVVKEILQALQNLKRPYSFLLVFHVGLVDADEINKMYGLKNVLGSSYLEHTTVLFSHSDDLEDKTFEEFLRDGGKEFEDLVRCVDNRCHCWNNRARRSDEDVEKVLKDLKKTETRSSANSSEHITNKNKLEPTNKEAEICGKKFKEEEAAAMDVQTSQNVVRVLFLGMIKVGKTSSIRTLHRRGVQTENKEVYKYSVPELSLQLIDTPGFDENPAEIQKIIRQSVSTHKPHVIMIVMSVDRFSPATRRTMQQVQDCLGRNATEHTIILFTGKDNLEGYPIDELIQENADLREFVTRSGNRVHALSNKDLSDQRQVDELLQRIAAMNAENRGELYKEENRR